jgi:vancomycin resistance protein YoaR
MANQETRRRFQTEKARQWALARRIIFLALSAAVLITGVIGVSKLVDRLTAKPLDDGRILPNVHIAGINVGGLTQEEACSALRIALASSYTTDDLVVTLPGDMLVLSPENTGANLNVEGAVKQAWEYGRTGTDAENAKLRQEAESKVYTVALLPYLHLDLSYIYDTVKAFCDGYSIEMTQPTVSILGERPEYPYKPDDWNEQENGKYTPDLSDISHQTLVITLGTPDFILDPQALYNCVLDAYSLHKMTVSYEAPTLTEPDRVDLVAIFEQFCTLPVDAEIHDKTFDVTREIYGYGFDIETVASLLEGAEYGQQISVKMDFITPDITEEALVGDLFKDVLAEYTAYCSDGADEARDTNLRLACEALNGYVIKAGETFSFNIALGPCTTNRGYQNAPSYSGSTASILGGGISQISSAIYCGALTAGLQILERHSHNYAVNYTPLGFDAAVSYGTQDLRFVNTTADPIRLVTQAHGSTVTIRLLGTADETATYTYRLENQILAAYTPNTIYQPMSADNIQGYVDGHVLQSGISGYDIDTYLCQYDAGGMLISSTLLSSNHYNKRDTIIVRIEGAQQPPVAPIA